MLKPQALPLIVLAVCASTSGFQVVRRNADGANVVRRTCGSREDAIALKSDEVNWIVSPNFPDAYGEEAFQCEWNFNLPAKHEDEESASPRHRRRFYRMLGRALPEESMDVVFECDAFDIGVAQMQQPEKFSSSFIPILIPSLTAESQTVQLKKPQTYHQESGKCYGDSVMLVTPHNDTITLCGKRNGISLRLTGYKDNLLVRLKSLDSSSSPGLSCHVKLVEREDNSEASEAVEEESETENGGTDDSISIEAGEGEGSSDPAPFVDTPCVCGVANSGSEENNPNNPDLAEVIADRVVNGKEARPNEFPWQVAMVRAGGYRVMCGGSIISDRHVLTAAHCTEGIKYSTDIEVLLAEHDLSRVDDKAIRMKVIRINDHPNYNYDTIAYDFSILTLAEPVRFSKSVRPVCLPVLDTKMPWSDFDNDKVTVSGWGLYTFKPVTNGNGPYAQRLQKLTLDSMTNQECQQRWLTEYSGIEIHPAMLCARVQNSSACFGDSGGPLTTKHQSGLYSIVGVVSYGPSTCVHNTIPNVYARVTFVLKWIFDILKKAKTCLPEPARMSASLQKPYFY